MSYYIGLISGTSMDGVDAALVSLEDERIRTVHALTFDYPPPVRNRLVAAIRPDATMSLHELCSLDVAVGECFAEAVDRLLAECGISADAVDAIGSHGQTLRHSPDTSPPYTLQIGNAATIAVRSGIATVADFRSLDVAAGGQGAPLVPPFHEACFRTPGVTTAIINIGGIANITLLPADPERDLQGFDTGPGNCLLDDWIAARRGERFDRGGQWAASGRIIPGLLATLMSDAYIARSPVKSTGREYFNLPWLDTVIAGESLQAAPPEDVQATLAAFTVASIANGILQTASDPERILVCGGGVNNPVLLEGLSDAFPDADVTSTSALNVDPEMVEAAAFAWLASMPSRRCEVPRRLRRRTRSGRRELHRGAWRAAPGSRRRLSSTASRSAPIRRCGAPHGAAGGCWQ